MITSKIIAGNNILLQPTLVKRM